jgi:hypothetical protein
MADTGYFQINDLSFTVPPDQIRINRKSYNNFWQTLRTRSSMKLRSGFSELQISVVINLVESDLSKLTDLVSQVRVVPFVWVENQFLRNSVLAGASGAMVLALQQMEIQKQSGDVDVIQVILNFCWFNYLPYMRDWAFKEDLFLSKPVRDPRESRAWKLLYKAEQSRVAGGKKLYRKATSLRNETELSMTEYVLIDKKRYTKLNEDTIRLRAFANEINKNSGSSEFPSADQDILNLLLEEAEKQNLALSEKDFGNTTSMGNTVQSDTIAGLLSDMIVAREEELAEIEGIVAQFGGWDTVVVQDDEGTPTVFDLKSELDLKLEDADKKTNSKGTDRVLKSRVLPLDLTGIGWIPVGVSISFNNTLARVPLIGHPYPTYQHIGSVDAVVALTMMTTEESALRSLSAFYTTYEDQARKFRQIPMGKRNVHVNNSLINACGLSEFIFENLSTSTVKGQPGTYSAVLTLVDNPISESTREQLIPGQSFTIDKDIRKAIFDVFSDLILLNKEKVKGDGEVRVPLQSAYNDSTKKALLSFFTTFGGIGSQALQNIGEQALDIAEKSHSRVYKYGGSQNDRDQALAKSVEVIIIKMSETLSEIMNMLQVGNLPGKVSEITIPPLRAARAAFSSDRWTSGEMGIFAFFLLSSTEIIGVDRFQEDVFEIFSERNVFDRVIAPESDITLDRALALAGAVSIKDVVFDRNNLKKKIQALGEASTGIIEVLSIWQNLQDSSTSAERRQVLEEARNVFRSEHASFLYDFVQELLDDWNTFINDFLDKFSRSRLMLLPEFESVREMQRNQGMSAGSDAYPDFPMQQVVDIVQKETGYASVRETLKRVADIGGFGSKNIGMSSLLNPDFYIYNSTLDGQSSLIEPQVLTAATEAIMASQTDKRLVAEKGWLQDVYERNVIGEEKARRITEDLSAGGGSEHAKHKRDKHRAAVKAGDNVEAQRVLGRQEGLERANQDFHYDDYTDEYCECSISEREIASRAGAGDPIEWDEISESKDLFNQTGSRRSATTPLPPSLASQVKHRFSVHDALNYLPSREYEDWRLHAGTDPTKDPIFYWPTDPGTRRVSSSFGPRLHPIDKVWKNHGGIDLARAQGTGYAFYDRVLAAADGTITAIPASSVKSETGYGNVIKIKHANGYETRYAHLIWDPGIEYISDAFHRQGQFENIDFHTRNTILTVAAGDEIAGIGNSGGSTGPHLHFEIRKNKIPVDPEKEIRGTEAPSTGSLVGIDPNNESLLTKSVEQLEKDMMSSQGYSLMRAYPTFKLYFIESDLGERQKFAFDDFFSYSHVADIQMIRSRKIPADLVVLQLTNVSGVLSNRRFKGDSNENAARGKDGRTVKENPDDPAATNTLKENNIASLMLQPGTQIQLRLGYHNNPDELKRVFNGVITDVQHSGAEDVMQITCQSFAIELVQNVYGEVKTFGGWFKSSGKTSEILEDVMAAPEVPHFGRWEPGSGSLGSSFRGLLTDRWTISKQPQDDNIFAPTGTRGLLGMFDGSKEYVMYNTTIWDVFQEMTLRHPGYIALPVPYEGEFGPRMTMYFGLPDQLYFARDPSVDEKTALDALQSDAEDFLGYDETEAILESLTDVVLGENVVKKIKQDLGIEGSPSSKQQEEWIRQAMLRMAKDTGVIKPFRSYHVLTSTHNIISNQIASSSYNTFNVATVQYEDDSPKANEETGQIEFDEAETFTLLCDAGIPDEEKREMFGMFPNCVGEEMAKRYTTSLLKSSLKEGYKGEIIIMGNPEIKPYDICYIFDEYNDMYGPIEVEQVVHKFSQQDGFITAITPDMCVHVNELVTMATGDAVGLVAEAALRQIKTQPLPGVLEYSKGNENDKIALGVTAAVAGGELAVGALGAILAGPVGAAALTLGSSALSLTSSDDATVGNSRNPLGLVGTFIFRKLITRSQLGHPFRYSPLVLQGKPMIGGLPTKRNAGSFVQGIGTWFHDTHDSAKLYWDHLYDTMSPNSWINPSGDFSTVITGRSRGL